MGFSSNAIDEALFDHLSWAKLHPTKNDKWGTRRTSQRSRENLDNGVEWRAYCSNAQNALFDDESKDIESLCLRLKKDKSILSTL